MWQYVIKTGELMHSWQFVCLCYSGHGDAKNDPRRVAEKGIGPLPPGIYRIHKPAFDHPRCGKFCLRLIPDKGNQMYGRDGFLCHGDNIAKPGTASDGCIVAPLEYRKQLAESPDDLLRVIAEESIDNSHLAINGGL